MTGRHVSPMTEDIANRIASQNEHLRNALDSLIFRVRDLHWWCGVCDAEGDGGWEALTEHVHAEHDPHRTKERES